MAVQTPVMSSGPAVLHGVLAVGGWDAGDVGLVAAVFVAGFVAGILSALLGVGGAVVTTPAVRALGAAPIAAVGSTVPAILPSAIAGTLRYAKAGLVDWRTALSLGFGGSVFAVLGALAAGAIDARILMVVTGVVMVWSGVTVVRGGRKEEAPPPPAAQAVTSVAADAAFSGVEATEADVALVEESIEESIEDAGPAPRRVALPLLVGLGALSGFVAGVLGIGGGVVLVPLMTGPLRIPPKTAVASSLVAVAIFSIPALVTHAVLGHIVWIYALPLMIGVVPGARLGSRITVGASDRTVRIIFGIFVIAIGAVFAVTEAAAYFR